MPIFDTQVMLANDRNGSKAAPGAYSSPLAAFGETRPLATRCHQRLLSATASQSQVPTNLCDSVLFLVGYNQMILMPKSAFALQSF